MNKQANIEFERKILRLVKNNMKGFPITGAVGAGLVGSGTGGTIGLVKAIQRQNDGEMDEMDLKGKIKEYAKEVLPRAGVGAVTGAGVGAGLGVLGKHVLAKNVQKKLLAPIKADPEGHLIYNDPEAMQLYSEHIQANPDEYGLDMIKAVKKILNK